MSEQKIQQGDLAKAISDLRDLSKGHSSKGTKPTEVESMQNGGVKAGSTAGHTQISSAGANSERGDWAGSEWSGVADNGPGVDSISENGTDYQAQGKVMKSIADKMAKGIELSPAEKFFLKSFGADKDEKDEKAEKGLPPQFSKDGDKDDKDDKKDEKDMNKSLSEFAEEDEDVSKGFEVSEFLAAFGGVVAKSHEAQGATIRRDFQKALGAFAAEDAAFKKSLAEAIVSLGEAVTGVAARQEAIEAAPAHGFRALDNVQALEKGAFNGGQSEAPLNKALIDNTVCELVEKGQATVHEALTYNNSGVMSDNLAAKVKAAVSGQ